MFKDVVVTVVLQVGVIIISKAVVVNVSDVDDVGVVGRVKVMIIVVAVIVNVVVLVAVDEVLDVVAAVVAVIVNVVKVVVVHEEHVMISYEILLHDCLSFYYVILYDMSCCDIIWNYTILYVSYEL